MNMYQEADMVETKGLHPCAYETIWSVRKSNDTYYLDMTLTQRSSDYIMANYINKIQYVALQMMVASHLGYKIGKFCHFVQNLHVYDRHFEALNEILDRSGSTNQPYISLKSDKSFYDFTIDDFEIHNIDGIKKLSSKLEIAV
jgi:thymidylate synthase